MAGQTRGTSESGIKKIFATGLTEVNSMDMEGVGAIRFEGNKVYKYVKYVGGTGVVDAVVGDAVFYSDVTGYRDSEVRQDLTDMSGTPITAGVMMAAVDASEFPNGAYCWIQIRGFATLALAIESSNDAAPVAAGDGDPLVYGDADGALRRQNTVVDAEAELMNVCAIATDASAKEVVLTCPF